MKSISKYKVDKSSQNRKSLYRVWAHRQAFNEYNHYSHTQKPSYAKSLKFTEFLYFANDETMTQEGAMSCSRSYN